MTPAQDIDADFDHLMALILHSWSEREVAAAALRLKDKVHEQLEKTHALPNRLDIHAVRHSRTS